MLCLGGCRDAGTDPVAALVAGETRGALALRDELPALPDLAVRAGLDDVEGAVELWESSWAGVEADGRSVRAEAYRRAAPALAEALGRFSAERLRSDVGLALNAVGTLEEGSLDARLAAEVDRARALHLQAGRSLEEGDLVGAYAGEMAASDALRAVAPPAIARSLVIGAEAALEADAEARMTDVDADRVRRLVEGARLAMEAEDWSRAIRRAFYASQMLELAGR